MPEDSKKLNFSINFNTIITCLLGLLVSIISYVNHAQLETISLKQDKAILQVQSDTQAKFVAQDAYARDMVQIRDWNVKLSTSITDLKTTVQQNHYDTSLELRSLEDTVKQVAPAGSTR